MFLPYSDLILDGLDWTAQWLPSQPSAKDGPCLCHSAQHSLPLVSVGLLPLLPSTSMLYHSRGRLCHWTLYLTCFLSPHPCSSLPPTLTFPSLFSIFPMCRAMPRHTANRLKMLQEGRSGQKMCTPFWCEHRFRTSSKFHLQQPDTHR